MVKDKNKYKKKGKIEEEENIDLTYLYLYYQQIIDNQLKKIATLKKNINYKIDEIKKIDPEYELSNYELSNYDMVGGNIDTAIIVNQLVNQAMQYHEKQVTENNNEIKRLEEQKVIVSNILEYLESQPEPTPTSEPTPTPEPTPPPPPPPPKEYPINIDLNMNIKTQTINTYLYDYYNSYDSNYSTYQNNPLNHLMLFFKYSKYDIYIDDQTYQTENCFLSKDELLIIELNNRLMVISHYDIEQTQFIKTSYKEQKKNPNYGNNIPSIFYYGTITINGKKYSYYLSQFYKMNNRVIKDELDNKKSMLKNLLDIIEKTLKQNIYINNLHFENIGFDQNDNPIFIQYNSKTFCLENYETVYVTARFELKDKHEYWYGSFIVILYFIFSNCYFTTFNDLIPLLFQLNQDNQKIYRLKPLYSIEKYFKGLYTRSKYEKISPMINKLFVVGVFKKLKESIEEVIVKKNIKLELESKYQYHKFVLEDSDTNYGHNNLLWSSDSFVLTKDSDKQQIVKDLIKNKQIKPIEDQKRFFELKRYCINEPKKPNMATEGSPTLSFSLFIPNHITFSDSNNYTSKNWIEKYIINIFKLIIAFNHYFPQGNILFYIDHFLIEKLKIKINLKITDIIDQFFYIDVNDNNDNLDDTLSRFYFELLKYENYQFNNFSEELMFYLYLASIFDRKTSSIDFFVYEFKECFREQNGHITNGYIGQLIRYISVIQTEYNWVSQPISRPKHIIWRDAHTNCLASVDSQWIKSVSQAEKEILYLLPSNIIYKKDWHELISCNGKYDRRSYLAGVIQIKNSTRDKFQIPLDIYLRSVGLAFILNNNGLPLAEHRTLNYDKYPGYSYGIDEYLLSNFYKIDYFLRHSLYMSHLFIFNIIPLITKYSNFFHFCYVILLQFLQIEKLINEKRLYFYQFIEKIEALRKNKDLKTNRLLHIILSIFPTKYLISSFMFYSSIDSNFNFYIIDVQYTIDQFEEKFGYEPILDDEVMEKHKLTCKTSARLQVTQWCTDKYFDLAYDKNESSKCFSANYYSGFYFDEPPDLGIGILRCPKDMNYASEALNENSLINPLNKSDYKLTVEKEDFKNAFTNPITIDKTNGNIHYFFIFMLLNFLEIHNKELFDEINSIKHPETQLFLSQLIWKTLNYSGYDVPPEWINVNFDTDEEYRKFNSMVKKLSTVKNYDIFLIYILQNIKTSNLTDNKALMNPQDVKSYFDDNIGKFKYPSSYDHYKMAIYKTETESVSVLSGGKYGYGYGYENENENKYKYKYEKYKTLYLELKKSKIIS